jgi:hypothetical protein
LQGPAKGRFANRIDEMESRHESPGSEMPQPPFYHGTKAGLEPDDLIEPGHTSNFGKRKKAAYVYLTGTLDAAIWGAELAQGAGALAFGLLIRTGGRGSAAGRRGAGKESRK